jgi:hypothetical protein
MKINSPHTYKDHNKKCDSCQVVSKDVNKSIKYKKNLCIDCLKDLILNSNPSK